MKESDHQQQTRKSRYGTHSAEKWLTGPCYLSQGQSGPIYKMNAAQKIHWDSSIKKVMFDVLLYQLIKILNRLNQK
jgi:hypothetical protein